MFETFLFLELYRTLALILIKTATQGYVFSKFMKISRKAPVLVYYPAGIYLFKVNNRNTRTRREICSKLTIKIVRCSGVFIVNFEHISHLIIVFLILTLNM